MFVRVINVTDPVIVLVGGQDIIETVEDPEIELMDRYVAGALDDEATTGLLDPQAHSAMLLADAVTVTVVATVAVTVLITVVLALQNLPDGEDFPLGPSK